jgi:hypothetical protein
MLGDRRVCRFSVDSEQECTFCVSAKLFRRMPLARQKYWQIRTDFTTLLLYNDNLNLDYKDYSHNLLTSLTCVKFL